MSLRGKRTFMSFKLQRIMWLRLSKCNETASKQIQGRHGCREQTLDSFTPELS